MSGRAVAELQSLNGKQRLAVTAPEGPVLVLAGAGSGKTRVIVHRIGYLIDRLGVDAASILAVTFTNKAAGEMRERVQELLGSKGQGVQTHTFHALCLRLLRRFGEDVGLRSGFSVYGADDRKTVLRRLCREAGLSGRELPLSRLGAAISARKVRDASAAAVAAEPRISRIIEELAHRYQRTLDAQGAVDFDDLLLRGVELMECSGRARGLAARRFQHVLVDEYQDTNRIQYRLLRLLAPHGNVFVVGDDDQAIYDFRGADVRHILDFETDFPRARVVTLELNYRSTGAILRAASAVIGHNEARKDKRLVASLDDGERPELYAASDERDEAAFVARRIAEARRRDPQVQAAVLVRTRAQTRVFEEELTARKVAYRVVGGLRFYDRREVRDVLAYLRLALNPGDDAAFHRVVNVPPRGIGQATLARLERVAEDARCTLWAALTATLEDDLLPGRPRVGLTQFRDLVGALSQKAASVPPSVLMRRLIDTSGLGEGLEGEGAAAARERRENVDQLIAAAAELESREGVSLAGFLDGISLLSDTDSLGGPAPCLLLTLHAAKGLEFDEVFLPGLEEGLFPHIRSSGDPRSLEEERRLFYVGMTRARRKLHLTWARSRRFAVQASSREPSRFLAEIPPELLERSGAPTSEPALTGARKGRGGGSRASGLRPGAQVLHEKFGEGKVLDASGSGADRRLTVLFWKAGRKRLVARYAKLQLVD